MEDSDKREKVIQLLENIWNKYPNLLIWQLCEKINWDMKNDLFQCDNKTIKALEDILEKER